MVAFESLHTPPLQQQVHTEPISIKQACVDEERSLHYLPSSVSSGRHCATPTEKEGASILGNINKTFKKGSKSILTVGTRALCKHAHRDSKGFWGSCTGSETTKNALARAKILELLDTCVWINIHHMSGMPDDMAIVEIRNQEGV
jgi:hypothetical protein